MLRRFVTLVSCVPSQVVVAVIHATRWKQGSRVSSVSTSTSLRVDDRVCGLVFRCKRGLSAAQDLYRIYEPRSLVFLGIRAVGLGVIVLVKAQVTGSEVLSSRQFLRMRSHSSRIPIIVSDASRLSLSNFLECAERTRLSAVVRRSSSFAPSGFFFSYRCCELSSFKSFYAD